jgi:hypothetical protein
VLKNYAVSRLMTFAKVRGRVWLGTLGKLVQRLDVGGGEPVIGTGL